MAGRFDVLWKMDNASVVAARGRLCTARTTAWSLATGRAFLLQSGYPTMYQGRAQNAIYNRSGIATGDSDEPGDAELAE